MNEELELLRQLGTRMSDEPEPGIDVVNRVIGQIARSPTRVVDPRLSLISLGACVVAVFAILITWAGTVDNNVLSPLSDAANSYTGPEALLKVLER